MTLGRWLPRQSHEVKAVVPLLRPGKAGLRAQGKLVPRLIPPRKAVAPTAACLECGHVQDWLEQRCDQYPSLSVPRPLLQGEELQQHVDRMASECAFGRNESLQEEVEVAETLQHRLAAVLSERARRLVSRATSAGLPSHLGQQIQTDAEEVGAVLATMFPDTEKLILKLELIGENCCMRWHQDYYIARAIVSYNGCGTEYAQHDNVNFWELEHCGNNDHIVHDTSKVFSAKPFDMFLMKGKLFPGAVNGLVHKSPEKRYYPDGTVMSRLCLKIDVP